MEPWNRKVATFACLVSIGGAVHCGASTTSGAAPSSDMPPSPGAGKSDSSDSAAIGASAKPVSNASGLVVAHASANMPAFRLCFGNSGVAGSLLPLPDRDLMPQSNVVGVEVGSAVRLKPLAEIGLTTASNGGQPHTAYAIPEKLLRPPQRPSNTPCSALICPGQGGDCLDADQFYTLNALPPTVYGPGVHLLAVGGCVPGSGDSVTCGTGFNLTSGNAKLTSLDLQSHARGSAKDFLVQVAQLAPGLEDSSITVGFGDLPAPGRSFEVLSSFAALSPQTPQTFAFDRSDAQVYAKNGFVVAAGGIVFSQSLASIQSLSAPQELPGDFYSVQSNFVLLLLGNPADTALTGGPKTSTTDPGKVLHLLGVPVSRPDSDAGALDAGTYEGGARDAGGPG